MDLPIPNISKTWNHIVCGSLCWPLSLNIVFSRFAHVIACVISFLMAISYSTYGYATSYLSTHQLIDIWLAFTLWLLWIIWTFVPRFSNSWAYNWNRSSWVIQQLFVDLFEEFPRSLLLYHKQSKVKKITHITRQTEAWANLLLLVRYQGAALDFWVEQGCEIYNRKKVILEKWLWWEEKRRGLFLKKWKWN